MAYTVEGVRTTFSTVIENEVYSSKICTELLDMNL